MQSTLKNDPPNIGNGQALARALLCRGQIKEVQAEPMCRVGAAWTMY